MRTEKTELGEKLYCLKVTTFFMSGPMEMRALSIIGGEKSNPDNIKNSPSLLRHSTKPGCDDGIYQGRARDCSVLFSCSRWNFLLVYRIVNRVVYY